MVGEKRTFDEASQPVPVPDAAAGTVPDPNYASQAPPNANDAQFAPTMGPPVDMSQMQAYPRAMPVWPDPNAANAGVPAINNAALAARAGQMIAFEQEQRVNAHQPKPAREHWSGVAAGEYFTLVLAFDTNTYQTGTVPIQLKRNDVTGFTESAEANWAWAVQVIKE